MSYRFPLALVAAAVTCLGSTAALAQAYPNKPVELQVPFAPGGTTDIVARAISDPLGKARASRSS